MEARTGQTIYQDIISVDADNNPVSATTFDIYTTKDGAIYTGLTVNISLVDDTRAIFVATWSTDIIGDYQIYAKNDVTNVIFISNIVSVKPDNYFDQTIYVGL